MIIWKNVCSTAQTCNESAADAFTGQQTNSRLLNLPPRFLTNAWCGCVLLAVLRGTTTTTWELNGAPGLDAPVETKLNIFNLPSIQPEVPGWMFLLAANLAVDGKKKSLKNTVSWAENYFKRQLPFECVCMKVKNSTTASVSKLN